MTRHDASFATYQLSDRYDREDGRVFLTGTQALVRVMLDQARRRALSKMSAEPVSRAASSGSMPSSPRQNRRTVSR